MKSNQRGAAWPYLIILLGLFALSITAPRAWNRARYSGEPLADVIEDRIHEAQSAKQEQPTEKPSVPAAIEPPREAQPSAAVAPPAAEPPALSQKSTAFAPIIVKPLRAFGRQVIDPIVEIATRPIELPTFSDVIPKFDAYNPKPVPSPQWTAPDALFAMLDQLSQHEELTEWSGRVSSLVHQLSGRGTTVRPAAELLTELRSLTEERALPVSNNPSVRAELGRAQYALLRRLEVWQPILLIGGFDAAATPKAPVAQASEEKMAACLKDIEQLTATINAGDAWREYLLLKDLKSLSQSNDDERSKKRETARLILARLEAERLSQSQRQFVTKKPFAHLGQELQRWAAEPVETTQLMADLEKFERTQLASDAQKLADDCRSLRWDSSDDSRRLGEQIDLHYRNANIRIALTTPFINRFVPQPQAMRSAVSDTIAGVPIRGRSNTFTKVSVRTIPDPRRIRLGLEANGTVTSDTESDAGRATFYNQAQSGFLVRKLVLFGPSGLKLWPAIAQADSYYSDITGVETNFDGVPLVGSLVRNFALSQAEDVQAETRGEVENKVAFRARQQFDREVQPQLNRLTKECDEQLLEPLRKLGLEPTALAMNTTDDRITMRVRFAGDAQLAAFTPRPRAPSDSQASFQIHQSALNNMLEQLKLDGREFTPTELFGWIGNRMSKPDLKQPEDLPEDITVKFANENAIRVRCNDGRLELTLAIAHLAHGKKHWRDFLVKTFYQPDPTSLEGRFVRTGGIFLEGKSLQGKAEFVLRSIFSKALSADRPLRMVPPKVAADPRLRDLELSQFVVEDGWVGMAYAPRRQSSEVARRPKK